jgi:hypothetical protein
MEERQEFENQCSAISKSTGKRCRQKAVKGSDSCWYHGGGKRLIDRINARLDDPALMELKSGVATLRTLMDEHLARLDSIRSGEIDSYNGALEIHGKRLQSLSGELFAAIDKVGRIEERQRRLMTGEEVAALVAELREKVIEAVETMDAGASPAELAGRLAMAFDSVSMAGRGENDCGDD